MEKINGWHRQPDLMKANRDRTGIFEEAAIPGLEGGNHYSSILIMPKPSVVFDPIKKRKSSLLEI